MFDNADGRLEYRGNDASFLWPGDMRPGLWMSAASRMGHAVRAAVQASFESLLPTATCCFQSCYAVFQNWFGARSALGIGTPRRAKLGRIMPNTVSYVSKLAFCSCLSYNIVLKVHLGSFTCTLRNPTLPCCAGSSPGQRPCLATHSPGFRGLYGGAAGRRADRSKGPVLAGAACSPYAILADIGPNPQCPVTSDMPLHQKLLSACYVTATVCYMPFASDTIRYRLHKT